MPLQELTPELVTEIARQHPALQRLSLARNALRDVRHLSLLAAPLRRLDLSENRLPALPDGLAASWGARLVFLDVSGNAIESLRPLSGCAALEELRAGRNRVRLISELRHLQLLSRLGVLVMEGNPIALQATYRREVVAMLPALESLDGRSVSAAERLYARLQLKPSLTTEPDEPTSPASPSGPSMELTAAADSAAAVDATPAELDLSEAAATTTTTLVLPALTPTENPPAPVPSPSPAPAPSPSLSELPAPAPSPSSRGALLTPESMLAVSTQDQASQTRAPTARTPPSVASAPQQELLQSRVTALERILEIQDQMLQRHLAAPPAAAADDDASSAVSRRPSPDAVAQLYTRLLAAWRSKVVALMVQLKSRELETTPPPPPTGATVTQEQLTLVTEELEMWRQRAADAAAHRELERQRTTDAHRQRAQAETRAVQCVRTLALERERLQQIAEQVAVFCSRQSVLPTQLDALASAGLRRLAAMEQRLALLTARVQLASRFVAHREARLRNSEAAIEAERRTWRRRLEQQQRRSHEGDDQAAGPARGRGIESPALRMLLRPWTEQAVRAVFQRLDPYHTGLVRAAGLLDALRADRGVLDALRGDEQRQLALAAHVEQALRRRSATGTVRGNVTWGELVLGLLPQDDEHEHEHKRVGDSDERAELPPPFDADAKPTIARRRRPRADELRALSKRELAAELLALWDERDQLERRALQDAASLQRGAEAIHAQWAAKTDELARALASLERQYEQQQTATQRLETQLRDAERAASQAQHELERLGREWSEQRDAWQREQRDLKGAHADALAREQDVWQRELAAASLAQAQLQASNSKLELSVRQLERELARRHEQLLASEALQAQRVEDKVRKRDEEIAKLRRERNSLLSTLREQERELSAASAAAAAMKEASRVDAATQTHRVESQTAAVQVELPSTRQQHEKPAISPESELRRQAEPPVARSAAPPASSSSSSSYLATRAAAAAVSRDVLHRRLQQLETLGASLLAD
ncbi:hypothetical protein P43SY_000706 [Pythium insidiosum]|uniref:Uncharacterized protein n=1 Tax=Pythium insidiosum TaxID=114742 RepID=A0AAD5MAL6_PYTIN|nr:hypothetical protein P43SY_000706 [Pythium insidiosum]